MNKIKILLAATVFARAFLTSTALAYDTDTLSLSTNGIGTSATVTYNEQIYVGRQKDVALQITFSMSGAGTDVQTLTFARAVGSSVTNDVETLAAKKTVIGIAATGATTSVTVTNIPTYGAGYLVLQTWANGSASVVTTNIVVKVADKPNAP